MMAIRNLERWEALRIGLFQGFEMEPRAEAARMNARLGKDLINRVQISRGEIETPPTISFFISHPEANNQVHLIQPVPGTDRHTENAGKREASAPNAGPSNSRVGHWVKTRVLDVGWNQNPQCLSINRRRTKEEGFSSPLSCRYLPYSIYITSLLPVQNTDISTRLVIHRCCMQL